MPKVEDATNKLNQSFKTAFEGLEKESEQYQKLKDELVEYISTYYDFTDARTVMLDNFVDQLDDVSKHWQEINQWVEENATTTEAYVGSLSDIRNLFKSISDELGGIRRQTQDKLNLTRSAARLANDSIAALRQEGGLSDRVLTSLRRRSTAIQENYKAQLRGLGIDEKLIQSGGGELNVALEKRKAQEEQIRDSIQAQIRHYTSLQNRGIRLRETDRERLRALKDAEKSHLANLELLDKHNKKAFEGLDSLIKKERSLYDIQKEGDPNKDKAGENAVSVNRVNTAAKLMRKFGLSDEADELQRSYGEFTAKRVEARLDVESAKTRETEVREEAKASRQVAKADLKASLGDREDLGLLIRDIQRAGDLESKLREIEQEAKNLNINLINPGESKKAQELAEEYRQRTQELDTIGDKLISHSNLTDENIDSLKRYRVVMNGIDQEIKEAARVAEEASNRQKAIDEQKLDVNGKLVKAFESGFISLKKWGGPLGAALALSVAIFRNLLKFDEEAVKTKRVIGQWADASALSNTKFVTGTEVLKTMRDLGEQFHINPVQVFSSEELGRIAQAQKLTGMSAEAAGNLAVQSKISGKNANTYRDAIAKGANAANAQNHAAVNLSAVQNEVLTTSRAIALSYGNNTQRLAQAASTAKSLGMNLQEVEDISKNLMNFESSIQSEMQAQLLTGMQLNLTKAREYALNNDLEGVANEIKRQGMDAAKFSHMNYIQQDTMAKALGMSREQMSKMLIMQEINRGLTAKQVAAMTGMRKEDIEAISAQEKWQTMKQRFLETLVPLLEPILQTVSDILIPVTKIVGGITTAVAWIGRFGNLIDEDNKFLRGLWSSVLLIGTVIAVNWIKGLRGVMLLGRGLGGIFQGIGKAIGKASTGILDWVTNLGKAKTASQATNAVFDKATGRWRDSVSGKFVKTPVNDVASKAADASQKASAGQPGVLTRLGTDIKGFFNALGGIKPKDLVMAAGAALVLSGAVYAFGLAVKVFEGIEWSTVLKGVVSLAALTLAVMGIGAIMSSGVGAIALLAGAAAMVILAGATALLGVALQQLQKVEWETLGKLPVTILSLTAAGALALVAGPALLAGSVILLAAAPALGLAGLALAAASKPLSVGAGRVSNSLRKLSNISREGLADIPSVIKSIAQAVTLLSTSLDEVPLAKLGALAGLQGLRGVFSSVFEKSRVEVPEESSKDKQGITEEHVGKAVEELTIKQAKAQASAQEISVEQKATDLGRIENKMDAVIKAIKDAAPTGWDWVKFGQEFGKSVPFASR